MSPHKFPIKTDISTANVNHNHPQTLNDTYRLNPTTNKAYYQKTNPKTTQFITFYTTTKEKPKPERTS